MPFFPIRPPLRRSAALGLSALVLAGALSGCATRITTRGDVPDPDRLAEIKPGQESRREVAEAIGSPSTIGNFKGEAWIYVSEVDKTTAFFKPTVMKRNIVVIQFDKQGVVKAVHKLTLADGKIIRPVDRETPTEGNEMTILQQLLGNIGRFNGQSSGGITPGH